MTNFPSNSSFTPFAITLVCICIPTYFVIGCLNTAKGMNLAFEMMESLAAHIHITSRATKTRGRAFMDKFKRQNPHPPSDIDLG
jgi:hypothetical protein